LSEVHVFIVQMDPRLTDEFSHRDGSDIDDSRTSAIREERYVVSLESDCV